MTERGMFMKRFLATLITLSLVFSCLPAFAEENEELISVTEVGDEYFAQTISRYSEMEAEFKDPQIEGYTDEDFFGVYNGSEWTTQSLLNYEAFPELSAVEEAAKAGDYETAKIEIQNYYIEKFSQTDLTRGKANDTATVNQAILMLENGGGAVLDFVKLTREKQEVEADVKSAASNAIVSDSKRLSVVLTSIRKDGNTAVFYSKESDTVPYLVVTVNGRNQTYYPIADTYISAGDNSNENYGGETVLLAEESYSTIDTPSPLRVDSFTRRACLLFDLSDIDAGNTISNARLYISGNIIESSNSARPESLPSYKDIAVISGSDVQWEEYEYTWKSASNVFTSLDGEYGNKPSQVLGMDTANDPLIKLYNATGEDAYAYAAVRNIFSSIVYLMTDDTNNIWTQSTLAMNQFVADFPYFVADLAENPYVTPEKFTLLLKFIHATAERAVNHWTNSEETNNWGVVSASAVTIAALVYPEFRAARGPMTPAPGSYAGGVQGGWLEVGKHRVSYTAQKFLWPDGSCIEVSYSYIQYIMNLYNRIFSIANATHVNLREVLSDEVLDQIEKYAYYLMALSNPAGGGWQQGDCHPSTGNVLRYYGLMLDAFANPELDWFTGREEGDGAPEFLSTAYDYSRKATLRSDWSESALAAQINSDGGMLSHGHNDDLGLNVYAYGRMLLADPTQKNYDTSDPVTAWMYSTQAHNTIEINETSQKTGVMGNLHPENREFNSVYSYIQAESFSYKDHGGLDENFTDIREVLMISPEYIIVTDYLNPDGADGAEDDNRYAQFWHSIPGADMSLDDETGIVKTNFLTGPNLTIAPVENGIQSIGSLHEGYYENENQLAPYVRYVKNTPGVATFNTVLYPTTATESVSLSTENIATDLEEYEASSFFFTVTNDKTEAEKEVYYYNLHDKEKKAQRVFGKYETDGILSLAQKGEGKYEYAVLKDGTILKEKDGNNIVFSESAVSDLGVNWNGNDIILSSSKCLINSSYKGTPEKEINLALGKSASSSDHFVSDYVDKVFDGNIETLWTSGDEETRPWITVNLEEKQSVSKVIITDNRSDVDYKISYMADNGDWVEVTAINSYTDLLSDTTKPVKIYNFVPAETQYIRIEADSEVTLSVYEMEVYSGLANGISLTDLSIYAPDGVANVFANGESVAYYRNGDYIVFDESKAGEDIGNGGAGNSGTGGGSNHGSGGSGGGGGSSDREELPEKEEPVSPEEPAKSPYEKELSGHWGETEIRAMIEKGIVKGDGDTLNLKNPVTRAEFAALLIRALGIPEKEYNGEFSDVTGSEWYADTLAAAYAAGLMEGSEGNALPNDTLTREQMGKMLVSAKEYLGDEIMTEEEISFADSNEISAWAFSYVAKAVNGGLMNGMGNNMFSPKGTALREQAFAAIYRLIS